MAVTILGRRQPFRGLRRLNPYRDLRQVTALIAETFGADLDAEGRAALRDMQVLGWLGPLLAFVLAADPQLQRMLQGYVWIEEGRVVGNLSLQSGLRDGERWYISNVAVAPACRGRGIAQALVEAALEEAQREGGDWATLQVEADNEAACRLYARLGFEALGGMAYLRLEAPPATPPAAPQLSSLRPWRADDWQQEYELARAVTPSLLQWWQPLRSEAFRRYPEDRLGDLFSQLIGRRRTYHWVVEQAGAGLRPAPTQGRLAASLWLRVVGWRGEHRLRLLVRPEARGSLEEPLLQQALAVLAAGPARPTVAQHPVEHRQAIEAFLAHGFLLRRTLLPMRKRI